MSDESEIELLRKLRKQDAEIIALLKEKVAVLEQENALLKQKVNLLVKRLFGAGSEKLDPKQLELLLGGADSGKECASSEKEEAPADLVEIKAAAQSKPRGERSPRLPEHLPCVEEIVEPLAVQAAPQEWRYIGEEVSEQLDYEPARFLRRRLIRRKYVKRHELDAAPVIAPLPRATLARWMELAADSLGLVCREINEGVVGTDYIQMDETPIEYLAPGNGQTRTGYLWVCNRPGGDVVFHWHASRAAKCVEKIVPADFRGVIQCDGYAGYQSFAARGERQGQIQLAAC